MPPRFSLQGPEPYPTPTPPTGPAPFVPPATVPGQGPTFGGPSASTAPLVGVGYRQLVGQSWRLPSGRSAWDVGGRDPDIPRQSLGETLDAQPADQVQQGLFQMPGPELRALQLKLYDAGYYGNVSKDAVVFGSVDDATWNAYGSLLEQTVSYNQAGREVAWFDVLDETQRLRKEQGTNLLAEDGGPKRAPFVARTTAPEDIEAVAQHVARSLLGENADPALVQQIVAQYRAGEVGSQRAAYSAAETGGTVTDTPSVEVFAQQAIEDADPTAVTAYRGADQVMASFADLIEGPFGG